MAPRSRLTQRIEDQTKRNVIITLVGITIIIGLLWKFGVPLLTTASFMLAGSNEQEQTTNKPSYVAPPTLTDTFSATNSASVNIEGSANKGSTIHLYVNNARVESIEVSDNNTFTFEHVRLKSGENTIKAQAIISGTESDFSNELSISYLNKAPEVSVDSPTDGQEFQKDTKSIDVKGKSDPGVKVTVNDFWAIVDSDGNFSYTLTLKDGDNDIKVVASDEAGNKVEKTLRVKYTP